jgi:dihydroneopterin aldolase
MERIIKIKSLLVYTHLGVFEEERALPQELSCDICFSSSFQPENLNDELSQTVNYKEVSDFFKQVLQERPRKLLETVVDEVAEALLKKFQLSWIEVTIRKFILPHTDYVSVSLRREGQKDFC